MDAFVNRKRRRLSSPDERHSRPGGGRQELSIPPGEDEESTDVKLAILSSLHPDRAQDGLLEILLACDGSVQQSLDALSSSSSTSPQKKRTPVGGIQSALTYGNPTHPPGPAQQPLTKKGRTLHLYAASDIAAHTPCSIIHNFLPSHLANALIEELLPETSTFTSATFRLFDNVVQSPHTACFYVTDEVALTRQREEYLYNGSNLDDIREILPVMRQVSGLVKLAVNKDIQSRIQTHQNGKKLQYQSPHEWQPNAAFVNCYDGAKQNVGWHSDQLSYLGPRAVIGSLSLGVAREFRVRRIVPPDEPPPPPPTTTSPLPSTDTNLNARSQADVQGQISIHLPHNSLLVMGPAMQEEWKHSISPAQSIEPHPIAGNKRLNITYRWYREEFHPKFTPRCRCGMPTVLKCVQKRKETRGRYMWMCQAGGRASAAGGGGAGLTKAISENGKAEGNPSVSNDEHGGGCDSPTTTATATSANTAPTAVPGGCGFFEWAEFTDDGDPIWKHTRRKS